MSGVSVNVFITVLAERPLSLALAVTSYRLQLTVINLHVQRFVFFLFVSFVSPEFQISVLLVQGEPYCSLNPSLANKCFFDICSLISLGPDQHTSLLNI